jgi:hypothetical protein
LFFAFRLNVAVNIMHYLFALGLPTVALAAGTRFENRQPDPCAAIAPKGWYKPSQVLSCLQSFSYNETLRDNVSTFSIHFGRLHLTEDAKLDRRCRQQDFQLSHLGVLSFEYARSFYR